MPAIFTFALLSVPLIGAYAIFSLGISVIYRASRVLNLAHGAMAMVPAYLTYSLVRAGIPMAVALVVGVASGALLGVGVERVFVRRLRAQGPTAQTVGTVAVTGLLIALTSKIWGTTPLLAPRVFPAGEIGIGGSGIRYGDLGLFATAVVVSAALFTFFGRTQWGLAMRGAAQNRRAASLMGIDPDLAAAAAWALGGGLAALGGIMLAAVTNLDPFILSLQVLPAFVAALIGGLESLPGALGGSAIAGLSFGLVPYFSGTPIIGNVARFSGSSQLALTILTLVVMATRGRRLSGAEGVEAGLAAAVGPARRPNARALRRALLIATPVVLLWPWVAPYQVLGSSLNAIHFGLVALSIVVLTGWVGQISLAQASFVGIAALTTGLVARGWGLEWPANMIVAAAVAAGAAAILGMVALRVRGLYLAVATLIFAWMADAFLFKTPWLGASSGSSTIPDQSLGRPGAWPTIDLAERRPLFYLMAAVLAVAVLLLANLRDTRTGRAFFAVRGSEMAAASLGIDVVRTKLIAFAISGALAGAAGNVLMIEQRTVVPGQFMFTVSLQYLAIAVVAGLGSIGGALAAGALFGALDLLFFNVAALAGWLEVVSAGLLTFVLLAYPGGLAAIPGSVSRLVARMRPERDSQPDAAAGPSVSLWSRAMAPIRLRLETVARAVADGARTATAPLRRLRARGSEAAAADWYSALAVDGVAGALVAVAPDGLEAAPHPNGAAGSNGAAGTNGAVSTNGARFVDLAALEATARPALAPDRAERSTVLRAGGVTVQFGGLRAVDDASLRVCEGEIVGLIGPNGAGKTTLFNAILGLNDPAAGTIEMYGRDVTGLPPHLRARLGVARTFQVLQLFTELTVFDNLLVATYLHDRSGVFANLAATGRTLNAEADARERVRAILGLLRLSDIADQGVRGLPFGVLRMVELGRALVTGAQLVMLDEPASGLNEAETDRLAEVVTGVRALGVSVLLIEHDVRMVTGVSDYMYVLNQGRMLTEGEPAAVQRHPEVIAAYLGQPVEEPEELVDA